MKTGVLFTYNYSKGSNVPLRTLMHTYLTVSSKVFVNHFQNSRYLTMRHQLIRIHCKYFSCCCKCLQNTWNLSKKYTIICCLSTYCNCYMNKMLVFISSTFLAFFEIFSFPTPNYYTKIASYAYFIFSYSLAHKFSDTLYNI